MKNKKTTSRQQLIEKITKKAGEKNYPILVDLKTFSDEQLSKLWETVK